ncbi:site-specific integrase [Oxalobacteraceae sp. CFBP 13730]|nr:site-specific integrase [Oxalobacteraceae sp. CFBP 13730]
MNHAYKFSSVLSIWVAGDLKLYENNQGAARYATCYCIRRWPTQSMPTWKRQAKAALLFRPWVATRSQSRPMGMPCFAMYARMVGINVDGFGPHALRTMAITNTLKNNADLEKLQEWAGHTNIATTQMYGRRKSRRRTARFSKWEANFTVSENILEKVGASVL